ncbi:MAG TPA: RHS repeat-associated core domain-containing protein, partial [Tepidisphaeraceae bacterium]
MIGQADAATSLTYLLYDGHGSTRMLADAAGYIDPTARFDYDAFGNSLGFDMATAATQLLYSGERYDSGLKEQYLRARYYDQSIGRFSSFDLFNASLDDPEHLHKFTYSGNGPILYDDPLGTDYGSDEYNSPNGIMAHMLFSQYMNGILGVKHAGAILGIVLPQL